jgi:hypothetical protein
LKSKSFDILPQQIIKKIKDQFVHAIVKLFWIAHTKKSTISLFNKIQSLNDAKIKEILSVFSVSECAQLLLI